MQVQEEISQNFNNSLIGKSLKVLIDRKENNYYIGRTEYDSPEVDNEVILDASKNYLRLGDFAKIRINDALPFDLIGDPVNNSTF
jgi:ribosomal protein S12 methylthiotransferase